MDNRILFLEAAERLIKTSFNQLLIEKYGLCRKWPDRLKADRDRQTA
jgi:hypothetical protein